VIAKVYVSPKRAVLDPQGRVVQSGLHKLGYADVIGVRVGKFIEVDLGAVDRARAHEMVDQMCRRFLSNPIIEDYRFDLVEE